jgi:hypothetical protein
MTAISAPSTPTPTPLSPEAGRLRHFAACAFPAASWDGRREHFSQKMFTTAAHGIRQSDSHRADLRLRTAIAALWPQLPTIYRRTWLDHPDFPRRGAFMSFWRETYFRWRDRLPPILAWPGDHGYDYAPPNDIQTSVAGTTLRLSLTFDAPAAAATLAVAVHPRRRWDAFSSALVTLTVFDGSRPLRFRYPSLSPGWKKCYCQIWTADGGVPAAVWAPTQRIF